MIPKNISGHVGSEPGGVPPVETEAQKVIARMTSPSQAFQDAITEYVESEQAAINDNWDLTDEVQAFNVDSETNARIGWKGLFNVTDHVGSPAWNQHNGFTFVIGQFNILWGGWQRSTLPNPAARQSSQFISWGGIYTVQDGNVRFPLRTFPDNDTVMWFRDDPTFAWRINQTSGSAGNTPFSYVGKELVTVGVKVDGNMEVWVDGDLTQSNPEPNNTTSSPVYYGGREDDVNAGMIGDMRGVVVGSATGFDTVAHSSNLRKFNDRMLIEKHQTVVDSVLVRYTGLTVREIFEVSRMVARLEEAGIFTLADEIFVPELTNPANAVIGMKSKSLTVETGAPIHHPGKGYEFNSSSSMSTNLLPLTEGQISPTDGMFGAMVKTSQDTGSANILMGQSNNHKIDCRPLPRFNYGANITSAFPAGQDVLNPNKLNFVGTDGSNKIAVVDGQIFTASYSVSAFSSDPLYYGSRDSSLGNWQGILGIVYIGLYNGIDTEVLNSVMKQCANGLEINLAHLENYNIQDKTYDWNNRELLPDQLEELLSIIVANTDSVTTGRVLNIINNLGITVNAQNYIDQLETTHGWIVTLI